MLLHIRTENIAKVYAFAYKMDVQLKGAHQKEWLYIHYCDTPKQKIFIKWGFSQSNCKEFPISSRNDLR